MTTAHRLSASVVRLDRPAEAAAFLADPDAALSIMTEPVLLDEWQAVPGVLGAVKRAVDDDRGRAASCSPAVSGPTWPSTRGPGPDVSYGSPCTG